MNARAMLEQAVAKNASDIFLVAGRPLSLRKNGVLSMENEERLLPDDTAAQVPHGKACSDIPRR